MSKLLFIVKRKNLESESLKEDQERLISICDSLNPDNIEANPTYSYFNDGIWYGLSNPVDIILRDEQGILLGKCTEEGKGIFRPNTPRPSGNYALIRFDESMVECITDILASRTIWYYLDDKFFVASTSQRAIVSYLGDFRFEEKTIPWMISTGTLGPDLSWDKRIKKMAPDSLLQLDRSNWELSEKKDKVEFSALSQNEDRAKKSLRAALVEEFKNTTYDFSQWGLPLSGGYDSRAILSFLKLTKKDVSGLKTFTWGLEKSKHRSQNDAFVAKKVAERLGVKHQYFETNLSNEPVEVLFNRFLICGEGRIDSIAAYMDGFEIWKIFFEQGIQGVIRGDEGFGWSKVSSPFTARISTGLKLCSDIANLKQYQQGGLSKQTVPPELEQQQEESSEAWRDRLYHQFRAPVFLSALSDLKLPYVEQSNPFLTHDIINKVRELPDELRTSKRLFKTIVDEIGPPVPYASEGANAKPSDILKKPEITSYLIGELNSPEAFGILPAELISKVTEKLSLKKEKSLFATWKAIAIKQLPTAIKNKLKDEGFVPNVEPHILAFRLFLIIKMHSILSGTKEDTIGR